MLAFWGSAILVCAVGAFYPYYGCSGLTSVTIPNSVTSIGLQAFLGCSSLTSVIIGSGVETIRSKAFASCPELTDVYCYAEKIPSMMDGKRPCYDAFEDSYIKYATLHVPAVLVNEYKLTEPWSGFGNIVATDGDTPEEPEEPVEGTGETVTVSSALVAGFSSNHALDFTSLESEGVSAWIATGFRGGNVLLSRVYAVPAGEGVYVKAEKAGTYEIPTTTEDSYYMNMFVGVPDGATVNMYEDYYGETYLTLNLALSKTTGKPCFFPITEPKTYGKNKMYLHMPARLLPEYAQNDVRSFSLGIEYLDDATGISDAARLNDKGQMINDNRGVFNLNGQRLTTPRKGLNIIGGKKVVIK